MDFRLRSTWLCNENPMLLNTTQVKCENSQEGKIQWRFTCGVVRESVLGCGFHVAFAQCLECGHTESGLRDFQMGYMLGQKQRWQSRTMKGSSFSCLNCGTRRIHDKKEWDAAAYSRILYEDCFQTQANWLGRHCIPWNQIIFFEERYTEIRAAPLYYRGS